MLSFLKFVRYGFWFLFIVISIATICTVSVIHNNKIPSWEDIYLTEESASDNYDREFQAAVLKSRKSSVKVHSLGLSVWGGLSTMTGTCKPRR